MVKESLEEIVLVAKEEECDALIDCACPIMLHVTFQGGAKPSDVKERKVELACLMKEMENKKARYIDLVDLPEIRRETYKTAKETIIDNIIKFDNDDTSQDLKDSEEEETAGMFISKIEELKKKIKRKNLIKKRRE